MPDQCYITGTDENVFVLIHYVIYVYIYQERFKDRKADSEDWAFKEQ
jgi:hypothetical protein